MPFDIWFNLSDEDKSFVKSHNGKKCERGDEYSGKDHSQRKRPRNIITRRNTLENQSDVEEETSAGRKTEQFQDEKVGNDVAENDDSNADRNK